MQRDCTSGAHAAISRAGARSYKALQSQRKRSSYKNPTIVAQSSTPNRANAVFNVKKAIIEAGICVGSLYNRLPSEAAGPAI